MSRSGDQQLKQSAESLAALLLTAEQHSQQLASEKLISSLQDLAPRITPEQAVNYHLPRHNSRTVVHLAVSRGLWQCLEVLLKNGGTMYKMLFANKLTLL